MLSEKIEKYVIERIEEFKKELNEEVKQMIKEANQGQVKSVWDLKKGDGKRYYRPFLDGDVTQGIFNTEYDENVRAGGNAFLTKEEAEFEAERRKIEAIMRKYSRPFAEGKTNYFLVYNHESKTINTDYYWIMENGLPYFESRKVAQKMIDEIGEDRLKKYWFRVEE